jgi:polyisoprenyl-teichoic acid--peptidoglycan teichoic acid transferase
MASVRETWRAMSNASRIGSVVLAAAVVSGVVGSGVVALIALAPAGQDSDAADAAEVEPTAVPPGTSLPPLPPAGSPAAPLATPSLPPGTDPLLGTDGRFTVLLLGTDYRPAHPGNRTDAIMVVSVEPSTGKAAAFSIPRDTSAFPLPDGSHFDQKVNALFAHLQATEGDGGLAMKAAVAKAFGIELDGYVFIGFSGVKSLVAAVDGVDVFLDRAYYDPEYWVTSKQQGWGLPAGRSHLTGAQALIFARSRKGDNDFGRARRQQILVGAALTKVRTLGPGVVPTLLRIAHDTVRTDLPLARAADIFSLLETVDLENAAKVVFGPTVYADATGGSSFALNLDVDRKWIAMNFPPERPFAAWPTN